MDDKSIITALVQDEETGYTMLIQRYTPYISAVISGIAKGQLSASDMEEVAADVFFRIWERRDKLKSGSLKAYIAQAARNAAIDRLRKANVPFLPYDDDVLASLAAPPADELALAREQKSVVEQLVNDLKEPDREIFIRFYFFGERVKIIGERLQLNAATIKTKLHRTRAALKELLQERGYGCE